MTFSVTKFPQLRSFCLNQVSSLTCDGDEESWLSFIDGRVSIKYILFFLKTNRSPDFFVKILVLKKLNATAITCHIPKHATYTRNKVMSKHKRKMLQGVSG